MKPGPIVVFCLVLALLAWGFWELFRDRMGAGDVYPEYSSLRADPLGTRALYESLEALPGMAVDRSVDSPVAFTPGAEDTRLYIGMTRGTLASATPQECLAMDKAARTGARIVIAMAYVSTAYVPFHASKEGPEKKKTPAKDDAKADDGKKTAEEDRKKAAPLPLGALRGPGSEGHASALTLEKLWGFTFDVSGKYSIPQSISTEAAPAGFPTALECQTALHFKTLEGSDWTVLYRKGGQPIMMERLVGRGSIVLIADPYFLTNEALQRYRSTPLLSWVVGPNRHVIFQEDIHGGERDGGIMTMVRRFGFTEAVLSLLVLALFFVWKEMATFIPASPREDEVILAIAPTAGLSALLRRAIAPKSLFKDIVGQWRRQAPEADRRRIDALPEASDPLSAYNSALSALKRR